MKIVETFADFVAAAADVADADRTVGPMRAGQLVCNLLHKVRPDLRLLIDESDFDPFHDDARLPLFYDFVMRHWDD